jgi:uncharacterized protein
MRDAGGADRLSARLLALVAGMRRRGARVGTGQLLTAHAALDAVDPLSPAQGRAALEAVLCAGRADIPAFRAAFAEVFGAGRLDEYATDPPRPWNAQPRRGPGPDRRAGPEGADRPTAQPAGGAGAPGAALAAAGAAQDLSGEADADVALAQWSPAELLRTKDFAAYTDEDERAAVVGLRALAACPPRRRSLRQAGDRSRGRRPAVLPTLRRAVRHGGEVAELRWRQPTLRPRPIVLVCDVSGSMDVYARMLLHYLHACVAHGRGVEAFVFGTRLTRVTGALRNTDHREALRRLSASVVDAAGGTRIGAAIGELNRSWGARLSRGAIVAIFSDGWDRGEPDLLEAELARLRRCAHLLVWINPLSARPGYEPLARGMRQALGYADELHAGNSLASLELVAARLDGRRAREGDPRGAGSLAGAR